MPYPFVSFSGPWSSHRCAGLSGSSRPRGRFRRHQRKRAEHDLRAGEARYRSLIRATSQIVWTATRDGQVVEDSPTWRKHTGQRLEEMQGSGWIDAIHPEDRAGALEAWNRAVESDVHEAESRVRAADGSYGDFRCAACPCSSRTGASGVDLDVHGHPRDKRASRLCATLGLSSRPGSPRELPRLRS